MPRSKGVGHVALLWSPSGLVVCPWWPSGPLTHISLQSTQVELSPQMLPTGAEHKAQGERLVADGAPQAEPWTTASDSRAQSLSTPLGKDFSLPPGRAGPSAAQQVPSKPSGRKGSWPVSTDGSLTQCG